MNCDISLGFNPTRYFAIDAQQYISQFSSVIPAIKSTLTTLFCALIILATCVGYFLLAFPSEPQIGVCGNVEALIPPPLQVSPD